MSKLGMAKYYHKLKKILTKSYRLVVSDEKTFEERHAFNITPLKIFTFIGLFALALIILTSLFFISRSPKEKNKPVYSSYVLKNMELNKTINQLTNRIDSIKIAYSKKSPNNKVNLALEQQVIDLKKQLSTLEKNTLTDSTKNTAILSLEQQVVDLKKQLSSFENITTKNTVKDKNTLILEQQVNNLKKQISSLESVSQENKTKAKTIQKLKIQINSFEEALAKSKKKEKVTLALKQEVSDLENQISSLKKVESENKIKNKTILDLEKQLATSESKISALKKNSLKNNSKDKTILELEQQITSLKNQAINFDKTSSTNQVNNNTTLALEKQVDELKNQLTSLENEYSKVKKKSTSISIRLKDESNSVFYKNIDAVADSNREEFLKLFKSFSYKQNHQIEVEPAANIIDNNPVETTEKLNRIIVLDVRPIIESGIDPFSNMLETAKTLKEGETLKIINFYEPTPLIKNLKKKGFRTWTNKLSDDLFYIFFTKENII
jgi:myosin heavy subunit